VQTDASRLPFPDASFDAVIANHSLEHFEHLETALQELGRVVRPSGSIFIAVPDASTFSDRLYRWLGRGAGHVNAFRSRVDLIALVERHTSLRFVGGRDLMTSLAILNRKNLAGRIPKKLMLLGGGREEQLVLWRVISRLSDRWLGTRLSLYGWALYFGALHEELDTTTWWNVCVRCGPGLLVGLAGAARHRKKESLSDSLVCLPNVWRAQHLHARLIRNVHAEVGHHPVAHPLIQR
jgi:SAM-dependent methyltransferase